MGTNIKYSFPVFTTYIEANCVKRLNDIDVEIILQWTGDRSERFYLFSNGGENENGGTPITGIKTALTNFFKKKVSK